MAPAMMLACHTDLVDLDGPLWLAEDRTNGLRYDEDTIYPPKAGLWTLRDWLTLTCANFYLIMIINSIRRNRYDTKFGNPAYDLAVNA